MRNLEIWSADGRFGLRVEGRHVESILEFCKNAGEKETGGVLIGFYTDDLKCAVVTQTIGPPKDSQSGGTWFYRGVEGLQRFINAIWRRKRHYYLGEWHYHPHAPANPSFVDIKQMKSIADTDSYLCPEPVLLIIGGDPTSRWHSRAFVFPKDEEMRELR